MFGQSSGRSVSVRNTDKKLFSNTMSGTGFLTLKSTAVDAKSMTPKTKQREIKRITSNLPEVYNRYFFNAEKDEKTTD